jgi:carotenoid cleavage dioxygenase-like enzyme
MVMVVTVTFDKEQETWFRNRFVQTPLYIKELETQGVMGRGVFGATKKQGRLVFEYW